MLGEDSEAILDNADLDKVQVTIVKGPALVEAAEINKDHPITIITGRMTAKIRNTGIYRFENGVATVLQGKLQTGDSKLTYEKGWQVFYQDNYRARKTVSTVQTSLDSYSLSRSSLVAEANLSMVSDPRFIQSGYSDFDVWLFCPDRHLYTYMPRSNYRSPYGNRYYAAPAGGFARQYGNSDSGNASGDSSSSRNSENTYNAGAAAAAPAPTAATPSGQTSAPSVYIDSKKSPVGATTR